MIEIRTVKITWHVETGVCDACGVGKWEYTKESVECATEDEADRLKSEWLKQGKIEETRWGSLRPKFSYGLFRIRKNEDVLETQIAPSPPLFERK